MEVQGAFKNFRESCSAFQTFSSQCAVFSLNRRDIRKCYETLHDDLLYGVFQGLRSSTERTIVSELALATGTWWKY